MQTTTTPDHDVPTRDRPADGRDQAAEKGHADAYRAPEPLPGPRPHRGRMVRRRFQRLASLAALLAFSALVLGALLVRERLGADARVAQLERELSGLQAEMATQGEWLAEAQAAAAGTQAELDQVGPQPMAAPASSPGDRPVPVGPMEVALSFDDGPDPGNTEAMLDTLDGLGIKATFFLLGQEVERHPDLVRAIAERGHVLGNHSWSHPDLTTLPVDQMIEGQIRRTSDAIAGITGSAPRCMRPPKGATNDAVAGAASAAGMTQVLWNVDPSDYLQQPPPELAARVVNDVKALGPDKGAVVVMHDAGPQGPNTVASITEVVTQLKAAGYSFVGLC
jgi:peptidoglycan/xylan/chitin deacetylase (PgdA/CDA1 family)